MATRTVAYTALLLSLNLLFFTLVSSSSCPPPSPKPKGPSPQPSNPSPNPSPKPSNPSPKPSNPSPTPSNGACPRDTLKLGVCVDLLKGLLGITIGSPPTTPCCSLLTDLVDLEAAVCLCTTIKASVLGININLPIDLSLLLNSCGRKVPEGFKCA
ncbi:14 kDa proline-rich protein DC2.15-like [Hevea brasiliensis]|uniref:14 kDa proline-rich protein DC2.15-like n=1 Tax=Hevea brasiliensis TaxID=3981 RepID=UPI0025CFE342|nr:14 kDa proline-rich protein DC2.15-like [Hevea brasiliensis]